MRMLLQAGSLAAVLVAAPLAAQGESGIRVGDRAPVLSVNDLDGKPVNLGQWIGKKPVLIEFWATWCSNCEELLPRFREAQKLVGDRVEFIGVNVTVNQTPARVRRYLEDHPIPFRVLYDDEGASTRAYLAPATSYVVIVDRAGNVVYTGVGADQRFEPALKRVAGVQE
ncbi:MAG: TlpA family protein disulfide reductase [Gemmatimonadetes bacterium]|nr:TlpA family protein disulfide reductase [Gemmatimonadota bacterium]